MAEIIAWDKVIHIDDEDFERISAFQWRVIDNVAGRIGRRNERGRIIGLAATLIGKRPGPITRLSFRDKDLRNFSKANIFWNSSCANCGRPVDGLTSSCNICFTEFNIARRERSRYIVLRFRTQYVTVDG